MKIKNTKEQNNIKTIAGIFALFLTFFIFLNSSILNANEFGLDRIRECNPIAGTASNSQTIPFPEQLDGPDSLNNVLDGGDDFNFDQSNGYCLATVLPQYATVKASIAVMNRTCATSKRVPSPFPAPVRDLFDISRATYKCANDPNKACCVPLGVAYSAMVSFFAAMRIQYDFAQEAYHNTSLCGGGLDDNWIKWNSQTLAKDIPVKKQSVEDTIKTWIKECSEQGITSSCENLNAGLANKQYREWYYGGVERQDSGPSACPDVTRLPSGQDNISEAFEKKYPTQRYYMRGNEAGNYACEKFNYRNNMGDPLTGQPLSEERKNEYSYAYDCCLKKSRSSICIERKYCSTGLLLNPLNNKEVNCPESNNIVTEHVFCSAGEECKIGTESGGIYYKANYEDNQQFICAKSVNLCPYNFNVGGGTMTCDYFKDGITDSNGKFTPISVEDIEKKDCKSKSDIRNEDCSFNDKAGKCKNYCQYLSHCVVVGGSKYIYESSISSPYFSQACIDFVGDSKNMYSYGEASSGLNISLTGGPQKHFSAPIAQCVRETLENAFYNKAGHSKCANANEYPDRNGNCFSEQYQYQKDKPIEGASFFYYIQDKLKGAIKMVLTISIMMQGFKILLVGNPLKHNEIIIYIIKIGLVLFFAVGTAWQNFFFNGIYNVSTTFSTMVMNIRVSNLESQRDGCQFGTITDELGNGSIVSQYPKNKEYLAIFDTLDCKIARYLGFGSSATVANVAKLAIPGLLSPTAGTIGVFFAVFVAAFAILLIVATIRILHIFLTSSFAVLLLVYISPITITAVLFNKTKGMFDRWLSQLIGYSLQPVLLFAYVGLFITIFETLVSGSATYIGKPPQKELICDVACLYPDGTSSTKVEDIENCSIENGSKLVDPMSDSIACITNLKNEYFGSIPSLEPFGIAIPVIENFFSDQGRQKLMTVLKGLLVIYILIGFINSIPQMSSTIVGGETMPTVNLDASKTTSQLYGGLNETRKRLNQGAAKWGGKLKEKAQSLGSSRKKQNQPLDNQTNERNNSRITPTNNDRDDFI